MKSQILCLAFLLTAVVSARANKPNVVVVLTDDQGYGDLSCHGNPYVKTPNLDRLFQESIRFTDFHASSICTPTRSQLLTGIDAVRNGAYNFGYGKTSIFETIPNDDGRQRKVHLMPEYFKANGYVTGHFGKWHLGDHYPSRSIDRGFDTALTFPSASIWQSSNYWNNDGFDDYYYRDGKIENCTGYCNDLWFDETIRFIRQAHQSEQPFFVYLATSAMHTPLFAPEVYNQPYKDQPELTEQFYGMIANFDMNFGRLDRFLEANGLKKSTIVTYMSDNGGTFGVQQFNAGMQGRKGSPLDGGHRVPCFLRWPDGIPNAGRDIHELVIVQDILPTLIDLCDLDDPWSDEIDGLNVAPTILQRSQDLSQRMSVVQFSTKRRGLNPYAVLWGKWRLMSDGKLYHLQDDPQQIHDIADEHAEIRDAMLAFYQDWKESVQPSLDKYTSIDIGYSGFERIDLTCFDWLELEGKGNPSQQYDIRQGMDMHGFWNLHVHEKGVYRFTARRWPREADSAITASLPPFVSEYAKQAGNILPPSLDEHHRWDDLSTGGIYPAGKAIDISNARCSIGESSTFKPVKQSDKSISFERKLETGKQRLQIDFLNREHQVQCGAYYVEIIKVK
ncbi:Arylsulfatase [Planctomycetes bacterium CA13]|uniref:Arylsulfatase n=1 Tax=Novipirellula herctigrandis TaxID=2527986 RepID=A0A5C5YUX3_9BACT|nr:Arylsulfatase [Planctomycetes bacterium CA13]